MDPGGASAPAGIGCCTAANGAKYTASRPAVKRAPARPGRGDANALFFLWNGIGATSIPGWPPGCGSPRACGARPFTWTVKPSFPRLRTTKPVPAQPAIARFTPMPSKASNGHPAPTRVRRATGSTVARSRATLPRSARFPGGEGGNRGQGKMPLRCADLRHGRAVQRHGSLPLLDVPQAPRHGLCDLRRGPDRRLPLELWRGTASAAISHRRRAFAPSARRAAPRGL